MLRVSTVVAFCASLIGGGAVGAKAEITVSVPAGVHWRASPRIMPLWGPNRFWPGSGLVLRCLGPGFTVLALGPGFRLIFIHIHSYYYNTGTNNLNTTNNNNNNYLTTPSPTHCSPSHANLSYTDAPAHTGSNTL